MTPYLNTKELRRKFCRWYPKQYSVPFDMLTTEAQDMVIREFLTFTYQQVVVDLPVKDIYL